MSRRARKTRGPRFDSDWRTAATGVERRGVGDQHWSAWRNAGNDYYNGNWSGAARRRRPALECVAQRRQRLLQRQLTWGGAAWAPSTGVRGAAQATTTGDVESSDAGTSTGCGGSIGGYHDGVRRDAGRRVARAAVRSYDQSSGVPEPLAEANDIGEQRRGHGRMFH